MMDVQIICVGKLKERFYAQAAAEYVKRLSPYCKLTVTELPEEKLPERPSRAQIDAALRKEGEAIRARLPGSCRVVCLCVEGKLYSSEDVARELGSFALAPEKQLVFLIGGSFGLDEGLKARAQVRMSMSPMTFPHHLARVMLLEQLYRGFKIREGGSYHK